jgi:hypothetical protein
MNREPANRVKHGMGDKLMQCCFLCASLSPALAGLPHLMEYVWIYMISAWRPTLK